MMPKTFKVGAQVFQIVERAAKDDAMLNEGNYAYTVDEMNMIVIDKDLHETKKQVTIFHEIFHAARMCFESPIKPRKGAEYGEWEHYFIGIWETSMLLVLQDNPQLVDWLTGRKNENRKTNR